jgi:hypothetical protein
MGEHRPTDGPLPGLRLEARFQVTEDRTTGGSRTLVFDAGADRIVVRVHVDLTDEAARRKTADARFLVSDLFVEKTSPYPGAISNAIACDEPFLPVSVERIVTDGWLESLRLFANRLRVFGVCARADVRYEAALVHLYCREARTLYQIKAYTSADRPTLDLGAFLGGLDCTPAYPGGDRW